jgi:hypothetical protein
MNLINTVENVPQPNLDMTWYLWFPNFSPKKTGWNPLGLYSPILSAELYNSDYDYDSLLSDFW